MGADGRNLDGMRAEAALAPTPTLPQWGGSKTAC